MGPHAPLADFISLWVVVDPFSVLAIFVGVTHGMDAAARRRMAVKSVLLSYVVILFFIVAGQFIIEAIGLTLHVFQIGGGIVLMLFAISLVVGHEGDEAIAQEKYSNPAVYPLAVPAIAGPGVMLMAMLLTDNTRLSWFEQAQTATAAAVVLVILLVMLMFAQPITRAIGTSGASIIRRIMGMISVRGGGERDPRTGFHARKLSNSIRENLYESPVPTAARHRATEATGAVMRIIHIAAGAAFALSLACGPAQSADICQKYGPQTPRDITKKNGTNPRTFPFAPAPGKMNLCNIHFHTQAEHKGPGFKVFAGKGDHGGYKCNGSDKLTKAELKAPAHSACHGVKPGDTIEVHWVYSSCDVAPGKGLGSCLSDQCNLLGQSLARVETQVFLDRERPERAIVRQFYRAPSRHGQHQPKALPSTGTGLPRRPPSYTQAKMLGAGQPGACGRPAPRSTSTRSTRGAKATFKEDHAPRSSCNRAEAAGEDQIGTARRQNVYAAKRGTHYPQTVSHDPPAGVDALPQPRWRAMTSQDDIRVCDGLTKLTVPARCQSCR